MTVSFPDHPFGHVFWGSGNETVFMSVCYDSKDHPLLLVVPAAQHRQL